ncbi:MAG: hypothetical protein WC718_11190, partial [Phycisphaerales bacterium]
MGPVAAEQAAARAGFGGDSGFSWGHEHLAGQKIHTTPAAYSASVEKGVGMATITKKDLVERI